MALVTGASGGTGAFVFALAREGRDLVTYDALDKVPDATPYPKPGQRDFDQTRHSAGENGVRCAATQAGLRDPSRGAELGVVMAIGDLGRHDSLMADQAVTIEKSIASMPPEIFGTVTRNKIETVFYVPSPTLKHMRSQGHGPVIGVSSGPGHHAKPESPAGIR